MTLLDAKVNPSESADGRAICDARLQASRRLDWRFLLPEVQWTSVMYCGPADGDLLAAMEEFGMAVTVLDTVSQLESHTTRYELVVATRPSLEVLGRLVSSIASGGWLYVEAGREWRPAGGLRHAPQYVNALRTWGLADVQTYWHWPNFEHCEEIVPLTDRAALAQTMARRGSDMKARMKIGVGRGLLRLGLLPRLAPYFSVLAQKRTQW